MSEPTPSEIMREIKALQDLAKNHLSCKEAAYRLGRGYSTVSLWRSQCPTNRLGIPFTKGFHWTDEGKITYFYDRCDAWLKNKPEQYDEFVEFRRYVFKISKSKISLAS